MDLFQVLRDAARLVWRWQFRLPEPVLWLALSLLSPALVLEVSEPAAIAGVPWGLALVTVLRWHRHRALARRGLAIARFSALQGSGRPEQVQNVVLTSLQDALPPADMARVHAVPALVGTHERSYAIKLRRRLRARFLLHGRIDEQGEGYGVFARVVQPVDRGVTHVDWHTRDVTPARARWGALIELLTPSLSVDVAEYPLEFTGELEAIVRGTGGQVAADFGDKEEAEKMLRSALAVAPESTAHQVDRLRADLAQAIFDQGRRDEALTLLRSRSTSNSASPYLLRRLFELLGPQRGDFTPDWDPEEQQEAIAALRQAAKDESDPQRDITLYNLAQQLGPQGPEAAREADRIRADLMATSRYYRGTWYLRRELGAGHYQVAEDLSANGRLEEARREYRLAGRWYSRAVRARPRLRFFEVQGQSAALVRRIRPSATLLANAWDAHRKGGNRIRTLWYYARLRWEQRHLRRLGMKHFQRSAWEAAHAYFDWAKVGYRDQFESYFWFYDAICLQQLGEHGRAEESWKTAYEAEPLVLIVRASMVEPDRTPALPLGVPGDEPTDMQTVIDMLTKRGILESEGAG